MSQHDDLAEAVFEVLKVTVTSEGFDLNVVAHGIARGALTDHVLVRRDDLRETRRVLTDWYGGPDEQFHASRALLDHLPDPDLEPM